MTKVIMKRALYLRPPDLNCTGLDGAVPAWLRTQGIEPVDDGQYDLVVYLPYDGGGGYYHANVSPEMTSTLVANIAQGMETRQIHIRLANTYPAGTDESESVHEILESVEIDWAPLGHSCRPTLAIMSPSEVERADWQIRNERVLGDHEVGSHWRPK